MSDKIFLKNMVFYGFHGVHEFERELGQRFYVDLAIKGNFLAAGQTDDLKDAIDYVSIYNKTKGLMRDKRFTLLEALGAKIAEEILKMHQILEEVTVTIRKPSVPIAGVLDYVEIEITRGR